MTRRQLDCIRMVAEGKPQKAIGAALGVSAESVEGHLKAASIRLKRQNNIAAWTRWAYYHGLVNEV